MLSVPLGVFSFVLPSAVAPLTKFTKDSNDTANLLQSRLFSQELHYFLKALYPSAHINIYFFINRIRQGRMTVLKRRFKALDRSLTPLIPIISSSDDIETADCLYFCIQLRDGQCLFRKNGDQCILQHRNRCVSALNTAYLTFLHSFHNRSLH